MDTPSWKKKLAAVGLVGGLAAIVAVALTLFVGGFTATVPLTVLSQRSGLVMEPDAKVKLRGVEVGRVSAIRHTEDGAVLELAMQPGQMQLIPANAEVAIESTTVFGAKFVNIIVPENPAPTPIGEGAVIEAHSVTVEFNSVFEHLSDVLAQIQPEKLNATLGALSEALRGRGDRLGAALAEADAYLAEMNPSLPQLQYDLSAAATVTNVYADTAPDLMGTIGNATEIGNTVVEMESQLDLLLLNLIGLGNTGGEVLGENEQQIITALDVLEPTTSLLGRYSPELTCFIVGLNQARIQFEPMAGAGDYPALLLSTSFMGGATPYNQALDLPVVQATGGPNCWGLPGFDPKVDGNAPFVVTRTAEVPFRPETESGLRESSIFRELFGDYLPVGG